jgi:hypothetical protein
MGFWQDFEHQQPIQISSGPQQPVTGVEGDNIWLDNKSLIQEDLILLSTQPRLISPTYQGTQLGIACEQLPQGPAIVTTQIVTGAKGDIALGPVGATIRLVLIDFEGIMSPQLSKFPITQEILTVARVIRAKMLRTHKPTIPIKE